MVYALWVTYKGVKEVGTVFLQTDLLFVPVSMPLLSWWTTAASVAVLPFPIPALPLPSPALFLA